MSKSGKLRNLYNILVSLGHVVEQPGHGLPGAAHVHAAHPRLAVHAQPDLDLVLGHGEERALAGEAAGRQREAHRAHAGRHLLDGRGDGGEAAANQRSVSWYRAELSANHSSPAALLRHGAGYLEDEHGAAQPAAARALVHAGEGAVLAADEHLHLQRSNTEFFKKKSLMINISI